MVEMQADIWEPRFEASYRIIPINTTVKVTGELVMGAGLAAEAVKRYPFLPLFLGQAYLTKPGKKGFNTGVLIEDNFRLIAFPTKINWRYSSTYDLIEDGLRQLRAIDFKNHLIVSPRLGCGLGGLNWQKVKLLIEQYFPLDNFIVVSL